MGYERSSSELYQILKRGEVLSEGLTVYRGDTRDREEIRRAGGFIPAMDAEDADPAKNREAALEQARTQARKFVNYSPTNDFINAWKHPLSYEGHELMPLIKNCKGHMKGVCCGLEGAQMGGKYYKITLPELHFIQENHTGQIAIVYIYGNGDKIDNSDVLVMFLRVGMNLEEAVILTAVPDEWIEAE